MQVERRWQHWQLRISFFPPIPEPALSTAPPPPPVAAVSAQRRALAAALRDAMIGTDVARLDGALMGDKFGLCRLEWFLPSVGQWLRH